MTTERTDHARERGIALVYVGVFLVPLLLCTGLAVDLGRGYLVRVALAKAVDAAALAAARNIAGDLSRAQDVANNIFNANFPAGFLGVTALQNPPRVTFSVAADGSNIITVASNATIPTTFMRIAKFNDLTVAASATATRRLVDMSFVIDRSGSLRGQFDQVKTAAQTFVSYFDPSSDRIALITFSSGTTIEDSMPSARGFNASSINSHIASANPNGPTSTAEALYEAWDQLRTVPSDSQSGLRIVVLFTDGSPNAFPGRFPKVASSRSACTAPLSSTTLRLPDPLPGNICAIDYSTSGRPVGPTTWYPPYTVGLYDTYAANDTEVPPTKIRIDASGYIFPWPPSDPRAVNDCIPYLPLRSYHSRQSSMGIPTGFDLYDPALPRQRPLIGATSDGYPNHPQNAYNAARNLAEIVANAIRNDTSGASKIRIYTLGLGDLLNQPLGQFSETGSSILQRIANDPGSPDFRSDQLDGRYYYAGDPAALNAAFQAVRDQIVRLTQ